MITFVYIKLTIDSFPSWLTGTGVGTNEIGTVSVLTWTAGTFVGFILAKLTHKSNRTITKEIVHEILTRGVVLTRDILTVINIHTAVVACVTFCTVTLIGAVHVYAG